MPRIHRWTLAAVAALLGALLLAAPAAQAARTATAREQAALANAIWRSPVADLNRAGRARYTVRGARVSTVSRSWATASVVPKPRWQDRLQGAYVIAVQPAGTRSWVVVDAGTAQVGCGIAPNSVIADLLGIKTIAEICPRGEGVE